MTLDNDVHKPIYLRHRGSLGQRTQGYLLHVNTLSKMTGSQITSRIFVKKTIYEALLS